VGCTTAGKLSNRRKSTPAIRIDNGSIGPYGARIAGVGHYVPDRVVTNADLAQIFKTSDEWIVTRTGMKERRWASPEMASSDLCIRAARHALERANLKPGDIDCYVVATVTPDYLFPATACIVASKLGAAGKPAFDIEIACSGFIYGLPMAASFIRAGVFKRVMLIGVETLSKIANMEDRGTAILFGDGAGATVVERTTAANDCFLSCELGADGSEPEILYQPAGGSREPVTAESIKLKRDKVHMSGREVFKIAVAKMADTAKTVLARAHLTTQDVRWVIPHQANLRIIEAAVKRLGIPRERVFVNIEKYGNTSAASIPIALSEMVEADRLKDGDLIIFTGFGGGLSWGSVAWRWSA
jgi:3-oxoacyl-[acyl-carrier-protein] synthase-3